MLVGLLAATSFGTAAASAAVTQVGNCKIQPGTQCPGADLHGADLYGANLSGANLSGANLTGTVLWGADLTNANLVGANLTDGKLQHANLQGANLSNATLLRALAWRANVSRAGLTGANLSHSIFHDANFYGSQVDHAHLEHADFHHALLQHTNFAGSILDRAQLNNTDLRSSNFHGATLRHAQLSGADLRDAQFFHATFAGTNMDHANAVGAKFWPSNLESDPGALHAVFEKVAAHLDAYDHFGSCVDNSTFASTVLHPAKGACYSQAQPGGSVGFNNTARAATSFYWEARARYNEMTVAGTHDIFLKGYCSHNWASFAVTSVGGLHAHPTQGIERPPGSPGGPLALDLRHRVWYLGIKAQDGYTMFMNGWLLRQHHPTITPGPRPR